MRSWILFGALGIFLIQAFGYREYLLDDAYISLRYARNLADGHGLVFNPGERVEGYTNFLWVLLGAAFLALGLDAMVVLKAVSAMATVAILATVQRLGNAVAPRGPPATMWLLATGGFAYYATTGMETALFAALATGAIALGLREALSGRRRGSVSLFVLLALTRPEGVLLFGLSTAVFAALERARRADWGLRRRLADGLVFSAVFGAYFLWRWFYYGELLPNTFHAKVTGGHEQWWAGCLYLGDWAASHPVFALALVLPAGLLARPGWRRRLTPEVLALWTLALAWIGYVVAVGGDSFPFHRFFLPVMPWAAVLTSWSLSALGRGLRSILVAAVLLLVQVIAGLVGEQPMRAFVADRTTAVGLAAGAHLAAVRSPDDLLAVNTAGALPYASGLPTLDMLGLTEPAIARRQIYVISPRWAGHRRGWGDYVLAQRPALVFWYNSAGAREPHYLGDHQLADHPFFRFFYQLKREPLPPLAEPERPRARFFGAPFGDGVAPDLGTRFEVSMSPFRHTVAREAPIVLHFFERRGFADALWPDLDPPPDLDRFLDTAAAYWRRHLPRGFDLAIRQQVEGLCRQAAEHAENGRRDVAKELLSRAAGLNGQAHSPLVGHYVANVAVLEGNLFLAVQAQLEALRLDPDNGFYRGNLRQLLTVPHQDFTAIYSK
ncbi:MAG: hypothetical protein V3T72_20860 [Thermoanaerobaculia bacterium]